MATRTVQATQTAKARAAANADALMKQLATATPAQIDTWLTNNVTSVAQARTVLAMLIKAVAYLWQRSG